MGLTRQGRQRIPPSRLGRQRIGLALGELRRGGHHPAVPVGPLAVPHGVRVAPRHVHEYLSWRLGLV